MGSSLWQRVWFEVVVYCLGIVIRELTRFPVSCSGGFYCVGVWLREDMLGSVRFDFAACFFLVRVGLVLSLWSGHPGLVAGTNPVELFGDGLSCYFFIALQLALVSLLQYSFGYSKWQMHFG